MIVQPKHLQETFRSYGAISCVGAHCYKHPAPTELDVLLSPAFSLLVSFSPCLCASVAEMKL